MGGEAASREVGREGGAEVAKPQIFDGTLSKVVGFITTCKLYIKMKMRKVAVKEQIQWVLSYMQEGSADIWKENILEELEAKEVEYESVGEFLAEINKFGGGDKKSLKVAELKRIE